MELKRRDFIKLSATLGSGVLFNSFAGCAASRKISLDQNFGLQLYTLRDVIGNDPKGVLEKVASYGYKQIESYEGPKGMFWGMKNTEFKKFMDDLGMKIVSSHCNIDADFERKAAEAAEIGMAYLICPYVGPQKKLADFNGIADKFNQRGETCKKAGLGFAYHNHDYSFVLQEGQFPQDVLMQRTNKELVSYEMDIYWVVAAGQDPITWFNKYPGRFTLSHVKDRKKNTPLSTKDASVVVGTGEINFRDILKAGQKNGLQYYIVEQELYENTTPLDAARADADYMKNIKI